MIWLLACAGSPGENEDALGVPREDLAGCTATTVEDDGDESVDTYDDAGHLETRAYDDGTTIVFSTTLDDQGRPARVETPVGEDISWTTTSYEGGSWKVASQTRGRNAETYATTTWDWAGSTVVITDDSTDCVTTLTVDGLRWTAREVVCAGDVTEVSSQTWEDDRVVTLDVEFPVTETTSTTTYTWDGGLLARADTDGTSVAVAWYETTWDCP